MDSSYSRRLAPAPIPALEETSSPRFANSTLNKSGIRRASTACQNCKHIKRKCDQRRPCSNCTKNGAECVYDQGQDGRRRAARKRNAEELESKRDALDTILEALRQSDDQNLQQLLYLIRSNAPLDEILQYAMSCEKDFHSEYSTPVVAAIDSSTSQKAVLSINALCDSPIIKVPASPWTNVTNDDEFVSHLISIYFTWYHTAYPAVDRDLFIKDMVAGDLDCSFCSPLLVNSALAVACHFTDHPRACFVPGDPTTRGQHFLREARRLWDEEEGRSSLLSLQAGQPLAVAYTLGVKDRISKTLMDQLNTMAEEMIVKMKRKPQTNANPDTNHSLRLALWSLFQISVGYDLAFLKNVSSLPQVERPIQKGKLFEVSEWIPYPNSGPVMKVPLAALYDMQYSLHEIGEEVAKMLFNKDTAGQKVTQEQSEILERRLDEWASNLPSATQLIHEATLIGPLMMDLHLVYHWIRMILFNSMRELSSLQGRDGEAMIAQHARSQILQSAETIAKLFSQYLHDFGNKILTVWMPHTALYTAHVVIDYLEDAHVQDIFHKMCLVMTSASRRWPVMKGHVRTLPLTANMIRQSIPSKTQALLKAIAQDHWSQEEHKQFDSSIYPNYTLTRRQEPGPVYMGDLFQELEDMKTREENENY